jgi:hypothetical protein
VGPDRHGGEAVTGKDQSAGMALAPPPVDHGIVESIVVDPGSHDLGCEGAPAASSGGGPEPFERRRSDGPGGLEA